MTRAVRTGGRGGRSALEHRVEEVLARLGEDSRAAGIQPNAGRVVVLGGGTGLSTVLGGNPALPGWDAREPEGLVREYRNLDVGVCTTDDGGATGGLVRRLPMIGIGDMRKVMLSMVDRRTLERRYGAAVKVLPIIRRIFTHRWEGRAPRLEELRDPVRVLPAGLRRACPAGLRAAFAGLTAGLDPEVAERLRFPGQCMGNLLLTAAMFRGAKRADRAPPRAALDAGIRRVANVIGAPTGRLHVATDSPGTLIYEYANGVVATGQSRAARARRGCAVRRVRISFAGAPRAHARLLERLRKADLIVYAPGSLYSSMLPILLTPGVVEAIRANRRAVKVLGANLWIQEGETDMSFREQSRGFWVSELIEAYGRNIPGGIQGLFDVALATSLDTVPGSIIRTYALEGKHPIHLDRARVAAFGVTPVEASLFEGGRGPRDTMLHHDPARFAAAVRTIHEGCCRAELNCRRKETRRAGPAALPGPRVLTGASAAARMEAVRAVLAGKAIRPAGLRARLEDFLWRHGDVPPEHLDYFNGVRVVADARWARSRDWDNVLGYFDPESRRIVLHEQVLKTDAGFEANFAVALGESLLGRYIARKGWRDIPSGACRVYEIELNPRDRRGCFLPDRQLKAYLKTARMLPRKGAPLEYWRPVTRGTGFLPSGIQFGLMYAWMLDNAFVPSLDYELRMLLWPASRLLPYQVRRRARHRELVNFFRRDVFRNG